MAMRSGRTDSVNFSRRLSNTNRVVAEMNERSEAIMEGNKPSNMMMEHPTNMKKLERNMEVNRISGRKRVSSTLEEGL